MVKFLGTKYLVHKGDCFVIKFFFNIVLGLFRMTVYMVEHLGASV
jgi:small basic protein